MKSLTQITWSEYVEIVHGHVQSMFNGLIRYLPIGTWNNTAFNLLAWDRLYVVLGDRVGLREPVSG